MAAGRPMFSWMRVTEAVIIAVIVSAVSMYSAFAVMQSNIEKLTASVQAQVTMIARHDALPAHREQQVWNASVARRLSHIESTVKVLWEEIRTRNEN